MAARRAGSNHPAESMVGEYVSGNYFSLFGVGAYAGRVLSMQDDHKGAEPVAVMNYRTWVQKYGQDPSVVGAAFSFNGQSFTVVGIAPPGILRRPAGSRSAGILDSADGRAVVDYLQLRFSISRI